MVQHRKTKEERKVQIADAAIMIIGNRGLRSFTTANLAAEIGITDGAIFRYFPDKRAVLLAVVERVEELLSVSTPTPHSNPLVHLEEFLIHRLGRMVRHPGLFSLVFSDHLAHSLGDEGQRRIAAIRNRGRVIVKNALSNARDIGLIDAEVNIDMAALLVNGMVMSLLFAMKDGAVCGSIEDLAIENWKSLTNLLKTKGKFS